jgi:large subunit ribosomal protein L17
MRHQRTGKKLGRDSAHRRALYANLASELIEHERIRTTLTKAKAVKPIAEQMITLGRRGDIHARRQAVAFLGSKDIVHKLFADLGPRYAERPGGYLRIVRLGPRPGDAAEMVYLELVDTPLAFRETARAEVHDAAEEAAAVDEDETHEAEDEAAGDEGAEETGADAEVTDATAGADGPEGEAEAVAAEAPAAEPESPEPGPAGGEEPEAGAEPAARES